MRLDTGRVEAAIQDANGAPHYVLPNADGMAYGNFVLDRRSREWLLAHLGDREAFRMPAGREAAGDVRRGSALVILWEEMLDGRVTPTVMLDALLRALPQETNELTVQRMLGYTQQAWWRWIPASERTARTAALEALLRTGLDAAATPSLKSAWFNALRDTALTPPTLRWLARVWARAEKVPGLVLSEPDFITLAQELAVRGVPDAATILQQQITRTENPDRRARMEFVRPALAADQETRDRFFASLADPVNRRREAWVLEALGYLHHPLRAGASAPYVDASLNLLREIQRTGDIFFPKRWMDATLSGHTSPAIADQVRSFVAALPPDYPDRLRRVILSSADDLFRVSGAGR